MKKSPRPSGLFGAPGPEMSKGSVPITCGTVREAKIERGRCFVYHVVPSTVTFTPRAFLSHAPHAQSIQLVVIG